MRWGNRLGKSQGGLLHRAMFSLESALPPDQLWHHLSKYSLINYFKPIFYRGHWYWKGGGGGQSG